jgi:hypothetical protein
MHDESQNITRRFGEQPWKCGYSAVLDYGSQCWASGAVQSVD